jgi:iron complex transport system ATP-binding protein
VLDEPVSALDIGNQQIVLDKLHSLAHEKQLTIIFTSHQPQHALCFADRSLLMLAGGVQCGASAEILTESNLHALWCRHWLLRKRAQRRARTDTSTFLLCEVLVTQAY